MFSSRPPPSQAPVSLRNTQTPNLVERRHPRFDIFIQASLGCPTRGMRGVQHVPCNVRNISRGGAAVYAGPGFETLPDMLILDIPMLFEPDVSVNCQVVGRHAGLLHLRFLKDLDQRHIDTILITYA